MNSPTLREHLAEGPFGLTLSSGFFGFFAHAGMLLALREAGLTPVRVSGSSAGALVGGLWAAGVEPDAQRQVLFTLRREDFWDPGPGAGILRGKRFRQLLDDLLPVTRFARTRVPYATSVHEPLTGATHVLRSGELARAIHASCAVPFMFHPVRVGLRWYIDGGVSDRPGLLGMPTGERVLYHHLSSRSPWRRRGSPALQLPDRTSLTSLVIEDVPRVGPFAMPRGRQAFEHAYRATQRALDRPLRDGVARV